MSHSQRLAGKVALVTGAGSGLGQAIALALAQQGAVLVLSGRRLAELNETGQAISKAGGRFLAIPTDITDETAVQSLLEQAITHYSKIDIAINCAGIFKMGAVHEMPLESFSQVLTSNTIGTWLCMKHEIVAMKKQGSGIIINISSNIGYHSVLSGASAYAASKAAVTVLTQTAALEALEALEYGIRINAISPGPTDTSMSYRPDEDKVARDARYFINNPSKRVAKLSEIASAVLWLCGDDSAYMIGQDLVIDGGASV